SPTWPPIRVHPDPNSARIAFRPSLGVVCRQNTIRDVQSSPASFHELVQNHRNRHLVRFAPGFHSREAERVDRKIQAWTPLPLAIAHVRSEEHTSELQSRFVLVCRLLLDT